MRRWFTELQQPLSTIVQVQRRLGWGQLPPLAPRANGRAERFIRTSLDRWADGTAYRTSRERAQALPE